MKEKVRRYVRDKLLGEFLGFSAGLASSQLIGLFFEQRGVWNLWGYASDRVVLDGRTFRFLQWLGAAIVGFFVLEAWRFWAPRLREIVERELLWSSQEALANSSSARSQRPPEAPAS